MAKQKKPARRPPSRRPHPPTDRRARFVLEYVKDLNATQAAMRAGYSRRTAYAQGSRLLKHAEVQEAIRARQAQVEAALNIDVNRIARELACLAFSNMGDYMKPAGNNGDPYLDFSNLTRDQQAALVEVVVDDYIDGRGDEGRAVKRVKFKLADKRAALVDLAKLLGLMPDRHELTGRNGGPIAVDTERARVRALDDDALAKLSALGQKAAKILGGTR